MIDLLTSRSVIAISGTDRLTFLQGLITNDVQTLTPHTTLWSALLTPQGRWLSEFFLFTHQDQILMDCPADHAEMLIKRLSRFRLRSDVNLELTSLHVIAGTHSPPADTLCHAPDPRTPNAGWRAIVATPATDCGNGATWLHQRITLGLPDTPDFETEKTLALEANMDLLHGVSWKKGCYMGQELTARTHYRGLVRRRLLPVSLQEGQFPPEGGTLTANGTDAGDIRSRSGQHALVMLRRDAWNAPDLAFEDKPVSLVWPTWFPEDMRA